MIFQKNKFSKEILFLYIVVINIIFLPFNNILGYFHIRLGEKENISKYKIKIANINEMVNEWIINEPPMQKYDINIQDTEDITLFLKELKNLDVNLKNNIPGYNEFNKKSLNYISLKDPPNGLLGIYIVSRDNPFQKKYPETQYSNTLEELLNNNKISIKEIYCFWNLQTKSEEHNITFHHIVDHFIPDDQTNEYINTTFFTEKPMYRNQQYFYRNSEYLKSQVKKQYIQKRCYNMTPTSGMIIPLPDGFFNGEAITNIYFDGGMRIINPKKGKIEHLLQMANGAKNIYIFTLDNSEYSKNYFWYSTNYNKVLQLARKPAHQHAKY